MSLKHIIPIGIPNETSFNLPKSTLSSKPLKGSILKIQNPFIFLKHEFIKYYNEEESMPYDVVTFGEIMLRLSTPNFKRLEQTDSFILHPGGAEANVAVAVNRLGLKSAFVTKLTDNPLGHYIRNQIRLHGVDADHIVWTPNDRIGI